MPELPEVETTLRGIAPHITGQKIEQVIVRTPRLRWPIPRAELNKLRGKRVENLQRRGKYLLLHIPPGAILLHLGMSGSLRLVKAGLKPQAHDHVDFVFSTGPCLRLKDPRRFGAVLWAADAPLTHPLLASLGPEPMTPECNGDYLYRTAQRRQITIKAFLMDHKVIAGVGNIYANEALFLAGIHPNRAAGRISLARYQKLCHCVQQVLSQAIAQGGTTLKDFRNSEGNPGYFQQSLQVYGKGGEACPNCGQAIATVRIGQRASFYCRRCQR